MEEWRVINDFHNYSVSNLGNLMNNKTGKFLKSCVKGGYLHISLTNGKIKKTLKVHRLVAQAFIENPENKTDVNHKNKNKLDNTLSNLEWMTRKENNQHRCIDLIYKTNRNKQINRLSKENGEILEKYNSIEDAGIWAFENKLTNNSHNGRNAIGNCVNRLSKTAYGFCWSYENTENKVNEEWREINLNKLFKEEINFDKKYFVSNLGRFKNSFGTIMNNNYKVNDNGYIRVFILKKTFALHRLVAFTFLDNSENKEQVNHKDGNKLNNSIENLEWCNNKENQIHKFKIGLGNNFTRKIIQYDLNMNKIKEFNSITEASKELNISKSNIRGVLINYRNTAEGFVFKYIEDNNIDFTKKISINKNIGRKVVQYDLNMNLINVYNSISDASRKTNIHKNNIRGVIINYRKTSGGFIWKYLEEK